MHVDSPAGLAMSALRLPVCAGSKCPSPGVGSWSTACKVPHARGVSQQQKNQPEARVLRPLFHEEVGSREISDDPRGRRGALGREHVAAHVPEGPASRVPVPGACLAPPSGDSPGLVDVSPLELRVLGRWHLAPKADQVFYVSASAPEMAFAEPSVSNF